MVLDGIASGAIEPPRILRVECGVGYRCQNTLPYHRALNGVVSMFSMEYCLAAALVYGRVSFDAFEDDGRSEPPSRNRWHYAMWLKYDHAARYPWLPVAPDPPAPEP